jgi:serine phosphatase RsbU (regulator of sigma subunit)
VRRSTVTAIPPGGLLCCYTDGLVERRDQVIDEGITELIATLDSQVASRARRAGRPVPLAEDASAAVMRALIGNARATDDVALLIAYREPVQLRD